MGKQADLFLEIWQEREHYCTACPKYLGEIPNATFFAHILGKGAYPAFKLRKDNIALMCFDCHTQFDTQDNNAKKFEKINRKKEILKREYHQTHR